MFQKFHELKSRKFDFVLKSLTFQISKNVEGNVMLISVPRHMNLIQINFELVLIKNDLLLKLF